MRKLSYEELVARREACRLEKPHPVQVILEDVRSLHNVGSILRTADAARIERVVCAGITPSPSHPSIHKTALGAQDSVEWTADPDARSVVKDLRARGYTILALEITDRPSDVFSLGPEQFPVGLVVGHEVEGVSQRLLDICDQAIEIPQFGTKQSLNVAVAFGIAVFQLISHYRTLSL